MMINTWIILKNLMEMGKSPKVLTVDIASSSMPSASDTHDPWKSVVEEFQHHLAQKDNCECKTEMNQYLLEASELPCALGFDILGWWSVNSSKYKILSYVTQDVMEFNCLPLHLSQSLEPGVVFWILLGVHCLL